MHLAVGAFLGARLIVDGDLVVQLFAGGAELLRVGGDDAARLDERGFGRESEIMRVEHCSVRRVQGGLPVDGSRIIGLGLRAGDGHILLGGGVRVLV